VNEDPRCCGSGTCIIDNDGRCWCGQQWDGEAMCTAGRSDQLPPTLQVQQVEGEGAD
jgi:hypothetical protein